MPYEDCITSCFKYKLQKSKQITKHMDFFLIMDMYNWKGDEHNQEIASRFESLSQTQNGKSMQDCQSWSYNMPCGSHTWISGSATTNCFSKRLPNARDIASTPPTLQVPGDPNAHHAILKVSKNTKADSCFCIRNCNLDRHTKEPIQ